MSVLPKQFRSLRNLLGAPRRITIPSVERPLKATITFELLDEAMSASTEDERQRARKEIKYLLDNPGVL